MTIDNRKTTVAGLWDGGRNVIKLDKTTQHKRIKQVKGGHISDKNKKKKNVKA